MVRKGKVKINVAIVYIRVSLFSEQARYMPRKTNRRKNKVCSTYIFRSCPSIRDKFVTPEDRMKKIVKLMSRSLLCEVLSQKALRCL